MSVSALLVSVVMLVHSMTGAEAFSNGLVSDACHTMVPGHEPYVPQTSEAPYSVSVNESTCSPGDTVEVTLKAIGNVTFKGFLLQARKIGGHVPVGRFIPIDPSLSQGLPCNNIMDSSVSHTSETKLTSLQATWEAPRDVYPGDVQFSATFLRNYATFWVKVNSSTLSLTNSGELNFIQSRWHLIAVLGITFFWVF